MGKKTDQILDALRTIFNPELGYNDVELGLIRKIDLENRCHVDMILTTPFCPMPR